RSAAGENQAVQPADSREKVGDDGVVRKGGLHVRNTPPDPGQRDDVGQVVKVDGSVCSADVGVKLLIAEIKWMPAQRKKQGVAGEKHNRGGNRQSRGADSAL